MFTRLVRPDAQRQADQPRFGAGWVAGNPSNTSLLLPALYPVSEHFKSAAAAEGALADLENFMTRGRGRPPLSGLRQAFRMSVKSRRRALLPFRCVSTSPSKTFRSPNQPSMR